MSTDSNAHAGTSTRSVSAPGPREVKLGPHAFSPADAHTEGQ